MGLNINCMLFIQISDNILIHQIIQHRIFPISEKKKDILIYKRKLYDQSLLQFR